MKTLEPDEKVICPLCETDCSDDVKCEHLSISVDDSELIATCVRFAGAESEWNKLLTKQKTNDSVESINGFISHFIASHAAVADVYLQSWDGGFPGLSGVWIFIWSSDSDLLRVQIRQKISIELRRVAVVQSADPEIERREFILAIASTALHASGSEPPLCRKVLKTLKEFCSGNKSYHDLALAQQSLAVAAAAAGSVGMSHGCANAAATLAVLHACDQDISKAELQALRYFQKTIDCRLVSLQSDRSPRVGGLSENLEHSIQRTFFTDAHGNFVSRVGMNWQLSARISVISAWNPNYLRAEQVVNTRQNAELLKTVRALGKPFDQILAWWPDGTNYEVAYAIRDLGLEASHNLAARFHQAAFFYADHEAPVQLVPTTTYSHLPKH